MHARQPLATVAVIVLLLGAGCVAIPSDVGDDSEGPEPGSVDAENWTVTVHDRDGPIGRSEPVQVDGELPVNATRTFRRVEMLLGANASAPSVQINTSQDASLGQLGQPSNTLQALGVGNATGDYRECGVIGRGVAIYDTVSVVPADPATGERMSDDAIELLLAHEFAHIVHQNYLLEQIDESGAQQAGDGNEQTPRVERAMQEGLAVAVTESYAREYGVRWDGQRPMELRQCLYERSRNALEMNAGNYYHGGRYYFQALDGTGELLNGTDSPPTTTEQLLHQETRGDDPPTPLSVDATDGPLWQTDEPLGSLADPAGEAAIRAWLGSVLDQDRVDTAATGWGNGTTVTYVTGDEPERSYGAVWVLRWDSRADATEFENAAREAAGSIEERGNTTLSIERVAPDTVTVAGGPASFVENLEATATNDTVTVSPPGESGASADD